MLVGKMRRMDENYNNYNKGKIEFKSPGEELSFLLWKAELNKELMSFWKSMTK